MARRSHGSIRPSDGADDVHGVDFRQVAERFERVRPNRLLQLGEQRQGFVAAENVLRLADGDFDLRFDFHGFCVDHVGVSLIFPESPAFGLPCGPPNEPTRRRLEPSPPLPAESPLWTLPNVFVTPHTAGETRAYEDNVLDILMENLDRLWRGEKTLRNIARPLHIFLVSG